MLDPKAADLLKGEGLNEIQKGYVRQLEAADAKGESGTIALLGAARKVADCLRMVIGEDAARSPTERRLPDWTLGEVAPRVVKPAAEAGIEIVRKIEAAASLGRPYFKFQGGLDVTISTLSQTRRYTRELVEAHPWPLADGEAGPLATLEELYGRASPPLEALRRKAEEERKLRWTALGPGRVP